jgi:putative heme transporter
MASRGTRATPERIGALDLARVVEATPAIALRAALVVLLVGLGAWWLYLVRDVVVLAFLALIIAAAASGPVAALEARGIRRVFAVVLLYIALLAVVGVLLALLVPPLVTQAREFAADLPAIIGSLSGGLDSLLAQLGLSAGDNVFNNILAQLGSLGGVLARIPGVVIGFLSALLLVTFLSALMLLERDRARSSLMRFVATRDQPFLDGLLAKAAGRLGAYVRGQLLIMLVTGVGSFVGLTLIGVPFALPLGIFAFLTEAVPIAGPIIAGIAMIIVALTQSPLQALLTIALVTVIQQAESLVLVPVIQGRLISISPVVALLAVLAGSAIADIPGAILAIPLVAIALVVIDDVILPWRRRQIGEDEPVGAAAPAAELPAPASADAELA